MLLVLALVLLQADMRAHAQSPIDMLDKLLNGGRNGDARGNRERRKGQPARTTFESELSRSEMRRLQTALRDLGYFASKIDGGDGPATREAVAAWAQARGWKVPQTLKRAHLQSMESELASRGGAGGLVAEAPASQTQPNDLVSRVQTALATLGYDAGPVTGDMNGQTRAALAAWARDRGWKAPDTLRPAHAESMETELASRGIAVAPVISGGDPALVKRAQEGLLALGYNSGETTGKMVDQTRTAIVSWARDRGWPAPDAIRLAHVENMESEVGQKVMAEARRQRWTMKDELYDGFYAENCNDKHGDICLAVVCDPGEGIAFRLKTSMTFHDAKRVEVSAGSFSASLIVDGVQNLTPLPPEMRTAFLVAAQSEPMARLSVGPKTKYIGLNGAGAAVGNAVRACEPLLASWRSGADPFDGKFKRLDDEARALSAWSAEKNGQLASTPLPPTAGPGPVVNNAVSWRPDDTVEAYQQRVRDAAKPLGGACGQEEETLRRLAAGLQLSLEAGTGGRVGDELSVTWRNNDLTQRIPVWIMVSADKPIRFNGKGHFALGPEAPNPFAIQTGLGQHRALVALAARGANMNGEVKFEPLVEGPLVLTVSLVGYLRGCEQELVLAQTRHDIDVAPDSAEIVLNTVEGRAAYTHRIEVPKFKRTILLNETRFLLLDSETGTEIVQRQGRDLQLSPTHRFIDAGEIVDIVDGKTVAKVSASYWALGDSYAVEGGYSWGKVTIASTIGDHLAVTDQLTGPACCGPGIGNTRISFDIENASFAIWGRLGHRIGPLQNDQFHLVEDSPGGYSSEMRGNAQLFHSFFGGLGTVSPISLVPTFDAAGGFQNAWFDEFDAEKPVPPFTELLASRLANVGLSASSLQDGIASSLATRLDLGANSIALDAALEGQLSRLGIETMSMSAGEALLGSSVSDNRMLDAYIGGVHTRTKRADKVMARFATEAKKRGWKIEWSGPDLSIAIPECDHLTLGQDDPPRSINTNSLLVPVDVDVVNRVDRKGGAVWVAQGRCMAGATYGSLRSYSALYLMDLGQNRPAAATGLMVASEVFFQNSAVPLWYDAEMRIKANDDLVLTYAPQSGAVSVWDRRARKFLLTRDDLPDGGLLLSAWLTHDGRYLVQLNSDGNIFFHDVNGKGPPVLSGRIVDDEIAVWTPDFRYDATAEAQALIDLKFPGHDRQYSLDRFGASRRVAGLGPAALGANVATAPAADIAVPPLLSGFATADENGDVVARLAFDGKRVAQILVFQDGVQTGAQKVAVEGGVEKLGFSRLKDARAASIFVTDTDGLASLPVTVAFTAPAQTPSVRRALVVGINTYANPNLPSLNYALADAERVYQALTVPGPAPFNDPIALKDRRADPDTIIASVDRLLAGLEKGDHAVIFFAGHGLRDAQGQFYLATSATDPDKLGETALPFSRLRERLAQSPARITILLDTCHSGAVGDGLFATSDELVTDLAGVPSNLTIVAASKGRQISLETKDADGGLFSTAVARVLGADRATYDANENGAIEASEFYRGVKASVVEASKGQQTPWIVRSRMVGDYALF
jgi:peptidoglycan hydrolase-like protein with peptidoglycan-binding domain